MTDYVSVISNEFAQLNAEINAIRESMDAMSADPQAFIQALNTAQEAYSSLATGSTGGILGGLSSSSASPGAVTGGDVVNVAEKFLGVPYVYGGSSPSGFDCSGLVQYVFGQLGISMPRGSDAQAQIGTPVASLAAAAPGDLLFFNSDGDPTGHVGIYLGNGMMIDAPHTGASVRIEPVWPSLTEIRQVVPPSISQSMSDGTFGTSLLVQVPGEGVVSSAGVIGLQPSVSAASSNADGGVLGSDVPSDLAPIFLAAGSQYGVSPQLLAAVAQAESGFDPNAVSSAGAEGIMQLMPSTAASMGVNPFDPAQAISAAAQLLSSYIQQFGSIPLALAAYNAGPGAVEQYGGMPPYAETQAYVNEIMGRLGGGE